MIVAPSLARTPAVEPAAGPSEPLRRLAWRALGTECSLQFSCADAARAEAFSEAAVAWVARFEARYSRFRGDSLLSRVNAAAGAGWVEVDEEMDQMLDLCGALHFMTQGVLDVTALPLLALWNFADESAPPPSPAQVEEARRKVGWTRVERSPRRVRLPERGMALDFGGWGKEFAVDAVAEIGRAHGLGALMVDFGRDLRGLGVPPGKPAWHVGIEDPQNPARCWGSIAVTEAGVASSGDYRRGRTIAGRRYGHIIDPRTGWPVANGCSQVTVVAPTCLQAGALSTAAFVLGPDAGLRLIQETFGAEGCLLTTRTRYQTRGFFRYVVS